MFDELKQRGFLVLEHSKNVQMYFDTKIFLSLFYFVEHSNKSQFLLRSGWDVRSWVECLTGGHVVPGRGQPSLLLLLLGRPLTIGFRL